MRRAFVQLPTVIAGSVYRHADGTQLVIFTCTGGANQRWNLP